jgi:hypothetical protein
MRIIFLAGVTIVNVIVAFVLVLLGTSHGKEALARDITNACADQNGASGVCTVLYDRDGSKLAITVGDKQVYCDTGSIWSC